MVDRAAAPQTLRGEVGSLPNLRTLPLLREEAEEGIGRERERSFPDLRQPSDLREPSTRSLDLRQLSDLHQPSMRSIGEWPSRRSLRSRRSDVSRRSGRSDFSAVSSVVLREIKRRLTWQWVASQHYFLCYLAYLVLVTLLGTLALWVGGLSGADAAFMSVSSITMAGLSSVDLTTAPRSCQVVVLLLVVAASPMLCSLVPVGLRLRSFVQHGLGDLAEARALRLLGKLVLSYWLLMQLCGFLLLRWLLDEDPALGHQGVSTTWASFFLAVSAFQNNGLLVITGSLVPLNVGRTGVLLVTTVLIAGGNVGFPILLRCLVVIAHRVARARGSPVEDGWNFLLQRPRKCFTHLFPAAETAWLVVVLVSLVAAQLAAMYWHDGREVWSGVSAVFSCVTTRTAGINAIDYGELSPATAFIIAVCMYISATPIYVAVRYTQEEVIEFCEDDESEPLVRQQDIFHQTRSVVNDQLTLLVVLVFFICAFEEDGRTAVTSSGQPRSSVWFLDVLFEVASAYGTVGLTRGSAADTTVSMSGSWGRPAQLCIMAVMFCGRCRGLPLSIDPSVQRPTDLELSMSARAAAVLRPKRFESDPSDMTLVARQGSVPDWSLARGEDRSLGSRV